MKKKLRAIIGAMLGVSLMLSGCSSGSDNSGGSEAISISGSTSVGPIMEMEGEAFSANNPNISIEVNQTGSSAGIKDATNGVVEIGMSSRQLSEDEKSSGLTEVQIALDGIAMVKHPNNPVENLTVAQVKDIYTGKITNWKEVGGPDGPIVVVSRESGSGTKTAFEEIVGFKAEELLKDATIANGSGPIKTTVSGNENSIGYMSLGYVDSSVGTLSIDGVEASVENIQNGTYKISRPFLALYKEDSISESGKMFIDFILSDEGQKIVEEDNLIRVK